MNESTSPEETEHAWLRKPQGSIMTLLSEALRWAASAYHQKCMSQQVFIFMKDNVENRSLHATIDR